MGGTKSERSEHTKISTEGKEPRNLRRNIIAGRRAEVIIVLEKQTSKDPGGAECRAVGRNVGCRTYVGLNRSL